MKIFLLTTCVSLVLLLQNTAAERAIKRQYTVTETITGSVPQPTAWHWAGIATPEFRIHPSCNASEARLLRQGLSEAVALAKHAKEYILRYGNSSEIYTKYFGDAGTGEPIGWLDKLVSGDRGGTWFRCDDIDGNCHQDGWGGHWRGANATDETVICPLSYTTRKPLDGLCMYGYTVIAGKLNHYFAADLIHRLYHMPKFGEGLVEHYADSYEDCLELAKTDPAKAVRNTHTLQYFALEVYAYDISLPGEGCLGKPLAPPTTTASRKSESPSQTSSAGAECHTHTNGDVHCT